MRTLQNILLVLGVPALGVVLCGLALAVPAAMVLRPGPGVEPGTAWGAAYAFLGCGYCGAAFGAVAGLVGAVRWITHEGIRPWKATTWVGVGIGLAVALAIRFSGVLDRYGVFGHLIKWWPGMVLFLAASGTLGGFMGGLAGMRGERLGRRSSGRRARRPSGKRRGQSEGSESN